MAAISAFPSPSMISRNPNSQSFSTSSSQSLHFFPHFRNNLRHVLIRRNNRKFSETTRIRAVTEETLAPKLEEEEEASSDQPVLVPVSPSDKLTMFFQAEGTMSELAVSTVTKALEATEGIRDLKVQILEGIASVELAKETTVQATGVASNLVEILKGSGFKLHTLNLSFEDEEDTAS
eukprot:TRINITY_DN21989_c0_g1_i1.p1 TRINITY_DN21989_c0_g1~~TRINITY_DN21989_c0_g1_i1.p1  ORF type:complete len:178 (-),score=30.38 TRINITY_DN21989_c0_g1_i1:404-937(-)